MAVIHPRNEEERLCWPGDLPFLQTLLELLSGHFSQQQVSPGMLQTHRGRRSVSSFI